MERIGVGDGIDTGDYERLLEFFVDADCGDDSIEMGAVYIYNVLQDVYTTASLWFG